MNLIILVKSISLSLLLCRDCLGHEQCCGNVMWMQKAFCKHIDESLGRNTASREGKLEGS